ncbi:hypothetical protein PML95_05395 [Vagococcus lutrae]|uniref:Uncharacterized protein n=1 Tax=Vagococcus lutrae TaxID=81947 RepID=A0AAF0BGY6_9ENTE|nr:hypothetical protein [Vagococcus lutrae]WCG21845.1 hypothetical protein PML95_05395 [Vagococcus lutrae]
MKICFAELSGIKKMSDFNLTNEMSGFYNQKEFDRILFASNKSKDSIKNILMNNDFLTKEIGQVRMRHLKNNSYFILSAEHMKHENQKEINKLYKEINDVEKVNKILDSYYDDRSKKLKYTFIYWNVVS